MVNVRDVVLSVTGKCGERHPCRGQPRPNSKRAMPQRPLFWQPPISTHEALRNALYKFKTYLLTYLLTMV